MIGFLRDILDGHEFLSVCLLIYYLCTVTMFMLNNELNHKYTNVFTDDGGYGIIPFFIFFLVLFPVIVFPIILIKGLVKKTASFNSSRFLLNFIRLPFRALLKAVLE